MSLHKAPMTDSLADDLLEGASAIAEFIFGNANKRRKVYHMLEISGRKPPIIHRGAVLIARKSSILRWFEEEEQRACEGKE